MKINRNLLINPASVFVFIAVASVLVNLLVLGESFSIGHIVYIYGVFCFSLGFSFFLFIRASHFKNRKKIFGSVKAPQLILFFYWVFAIVGLFLSLYKIYVVGFLGEGNLFLNLRYDYIYGEAKIYGAQHLALFSMSLAMYYAIKGSYRRCFFATLIPIIVSMSIAERTSILFIFVAIFYTLLFYRRVNFLSLISGIVLILALFVIIAISSGKASGPNMFYFIFEYFSYSITALNDYVISRSYEGCSRYVFGPFSKFIPNIDCFSTVDLHVDTRHNVYTYVAAPYLFAGILGVTMFMLALGIWYSILWWLAENLNPYFVSILSLSMYAVVMNFYAWEFSLATYFYMAIILIPLFYRFRF